jgi:hypothetical protein
MLVKVTAEDIANGQRENPIACPIALAVKRISDDPYSVTVGTQILSHANSVIMLPIEATNFISQFDAGCDVEPFEFHV